MILFLKITAYFYINNLKGNATDYLGNSKSWNISSHVFIENILALLIKLLMLSRHELCTYFICFYIVNSTV